MGFLHLHGNCTLTQEHATQCPLPLHRQHTGMASLLTLCLGCLHRWENVREFSIRQWETRPFSTGERAKSEAVNGKREKFQSVNVQHHRLSRPPCWSRPSVSCARPYTVRGSPPAPRSRMAGHSSRAVGCPVSREVA